MREQREGVGGGGKEGSGEMEDCSKRQQQQQGVVAREGIGQEIYGGESGEGVVWIPLEVKWFSVTHQRRFRRQEVV
jgi:hypothetical protein